MLPTGDVDPAWPADGLVLCATISNRKIVGLLPDGSGNVYVVCGVGPEIRGVRVQSTGVLADGWSACGNLIASGNYPAAASDGGGGIWVAWQASVGGPDTKVPRVVRLGPDGAQTGWSGGPRNVRAPDSVVTLDAWLTLAAAPGGGAYVGWELWSADSLTAPGGLYLTRLGADGITSSGWPAGGMRLCPFDLFLVAGNFDTPHMDISEDGRGGVFAVTGRPVIFSDGGPYSETVLDVRLHRIQSDASVSPGWPAGGRSVVSGQMLPFGLEDEGPDVMPDGLDGAFVSVAEYATEGYTATGYRRWSDGGPLGHLGAAYPLENKSVQPNGQGGLYLGSFVPNGPDGPWSPPAFLRVLQCPAPLGWSDLIENHSEPFQEWYGDISITPTGDGGAIFFWSQHNQIFGLFARRFGEGPTLDVSPPGADGTTLRAWFETGVGVHLAGIAEPAARIDVFDVNGRRHAGIRSGTRSSSELLLPGTAHLGTGIYFVRVSASGRVAHARVAVIR